MPWVIVIGATGFYLNHSGPVDAVLQGPDFSEAGFAAERPAVPINVEAALRLGEAIWPEQDIEDIWQDEYHDRPSFYVEKEDGLIILSIPTGHYFLKSGYSRQTFAPDGTLLHSKTYWDDIFEELHEDGWLGGAMGSWFADIVALSMVVFGVTGPVLWGVPRIRRWRRGRRRGRRGGRRTRGPEQVERA